MGMINPSAFQRGFTKHGVAFTGTTPDGTQSIGDCPFCEASKKFYVNSGNGLWDCKRCGESGDYSTFLEIVAENNAESDGKEMRALAKDRGILLSYMRKFGIGYDGVYYTIPAYAPPNKKGNISVCDLRLYKIGGKTMSSPGSKVGLLRPLEMNNTKTVWICEGEWDACCWLQILRETGNNDDVYGVTGATSFPKDCAQMFKGKDVRILLDNDEAGGRGTARIWNLISGIAEKVYWLHWTDDRPDKWDIRDEFVKKYKKDPQVAFKSIHEMLDATSPKGSAPVGTVEIVSESSFKGSGLSREDAFAAYAKWLHMEDLDVLDVLFGAVFANRLQHQVDNMDPFWLFLVAPSSGSKSELLMTLEGAPNIHAVTSLTPHALISGNFGAGADPSLIPELINKTLIIKDFTTILSMPQMAKDEIFGILRDAYDGKSSKKFGNGVARHYEGTFGIIAGVTGFIETHSQTSLGERFMKYRLRKTSGGDSKIIQKAMRNMGQKSNMREEMQKTAARVLDRPVTIDDVAKVSDAQHDRLEWMADWVAHLRGQVIRDKYNGHVQYKPEHETGARLAKQLKALAWGISVFRREKILSEKTMRIVQEVMRCTAPDKVEEIVKQFYLHMGNDYADIKSISEWTRLPADTCRATMENLELLNILDREPNQKIIGNRWRLSDSIYSMTHKLGVYGRSTRKRK